MRNPQLRVQLFVANLTKTGLKTLPRGEADELNNRMLLPAIIVITLALVFYSIGIWAEHIQRELKPWHAVFFGLGLAADASGTFLMTRISDASESAAEGTGGVLIAIMGVTGALALALMAIHLVWAIVVLVRNKENEKNNFHKSSLLVWAIWLVPYIAGAVGANL